MAQIWLLSFLFAIALFPCKGLAAPPPNLVECEGLDWHPYRDIKCIKIIKNASTRSQAVDLCDKELIATDLSLPSLVQIKSPDEQQFLTQFVFNTSGVKVNVWLGATRSGSSSETFLWNDGTTVSEFTNWVEGGPTRMAQRDCVQMQSKLTEENQKVFADGKWEDVTCEATNFVVCQKLPKWSWAKLQQTMVDVRKWGEGSGERLGAQLAVTQTQLAETRTGLAATQKLLTDTQAALKAAQTQLTATDGVVAGLRANPVPVNFIYVQLGGQAEPSALWPAPLKWTDVTPTYAGLFFRAEGNGAGTLGQIQDGTAPHLAEIQLVHGDVKTFVEHIPLTIGQWSGQVRTGDSVAPAIKDGLKFRMEGGEVRPRNQAVKIWKRTA